MTSVSTPKDSLLNWHRRLGHINIGSIKDMVRHKRVIGLQLSNSIFSPSIDCTTCQLAKIKRKKIPKKSTRSQEKADEVADADTVGPLRQSRTGKKYLLFIGNRGFYEVHFLRLKSDAYPLIKDYFAKMDRQHGIDFIRRFRGDGEFAQNHMLQKFFNTHGILTEFTQRDSPFQNGRNERCHQTVMDMARAMLIDSGLPSNFWEEAVSYAVYILNRLSSNSDPQRRSGYERLYKTKPDLSLIRRFGEVCFRKLPESHKQDPKGHECRLVGIDEHRKEGYLVYDLVDHKIVPTRDLSFPTHMPPLPELSVSGDGIVANSMANQLLKPPTQESSSSHVPDSPIALEQGSKPRRSCRKRTNPKRLIEEVNTVFHNQLDEPIHFRDVWFSTYRDEWICAMKKELDALITNGTWKRVKRPAGKNIISCRWVYKLKRNDDGSVEIFKARLVARGFTQQYGEDFHGTYSPVASKSSLRIFLVIARKFKLNVFQYDVPAAYVKATLKENEELYLELPNGFKGLLNDFGNLVTQIDDPGTGSDPTEVLRLIKGLYGLKQSGLYWNEEIESKLKDLKLFQVKSDKCLYYFSNGSRVLILLLYVDDILIATNWSEKHMEVVNTLKTFYQIKELGRVSKFLGMKIDQDEDSKIFIGQEAFVDEIVKKFHLESSPNRSTPLDTSERFEENQEEKITGVPYRSLVGTLLYLSTCTRPDIAFAVNQAAKFNDKATLRHWNQLKKIAAYVKSTKDFGLYFDTSHDSGKTVND